MPRKERASVSKMGNDISYVSDASTLADGGIITAEPLKSGVDILPRGIVRRARVFTISVEVY